MKKIIIFTLLVHTFNLFSQEIEFLTFIEENGFLANKGYIIDSEGNEYYLTTLNGSGSILDLNMYSTEYIKNILKKAEKNYKTGEVFLYPSAACLIGGLGVIVFTGTDSDKFWTNMGIGSGLGVVGYLFMIPYNMFTKKGNKIVREGIVDKFNNGKNKNSSMFLNIKPNIYSNNKTISPGISVSLKF